MGGLSSLSASGSPESNPAVMPWLSHDEVSFSQVLYLQETNYSYLNFSHLFKNSLAFNVSLGYLGIGGLERTVADSSFEGFSETGNFSYYDALAGFGFGDRVSDDFSYGVSAKYVRENIDTNAVSGAMISLGGYFGHMPEHFQFGFGVFNIGQAVNGFNLPSGAYVGLGKYFSPKFFSGGEIVAYLDTTAEARAGFELDLSKAIKLRAGCRYPLQDNGLGNFPFVDLTAGLGLNIGKFVLDYAWVPYGDLGQTHRLSLIKRFGPTRSRINEASAFIEEENKIKIVVYDLRTESVQIDLLEKASNTLRQEISDLEIFSVIERSNADKNISGQEKEVTGLTVDERAVNAARDVGAKYVLTGSISDVNNLYYISLNQFDVETGKIAKTLFEVAENPGDIKRACKDIAFQLKTNRRLGSRQR